MQLEFHQVDAFSSRPFSGNPAVVYRLDAWLAQEGETLAGAPVYSDSRNDLPLLSRVDRPHTVNPDPALLGHAREAGWPVLQWR